MSDQISVIGRQEPWPFAEITLGKRGAERIPREQRDPSTARPDATQFGAKEEIGPLRSG